MDKQKNGSYVSIYIYIPFLFYITSRCISNFYGCFCLFLFSLCICFLFPKIDRSTRQPLPQFPKTQHTDILHSLPPLPPISLSTPSLFLLPLLTQPNRSVWYSTLLGYGHNYSCFIFMLAYSF